MKPNLFTPYEPKEPQFAAVIEHPELYLDQMFVVRTMDIDGSLTAGWYVCIIRKMDSEYVFLVLFDSSKESFLGELKVIPSYLITELTIHGSFSTLDPTISPFYGYNLSQIVIDDFHSRIKEKSNELRIVTIYLGEIIIVSIGLVEVCL